MPRKFYFLAIHFVVAQGVCCSDNSFMTKTHSPNSVHEQFHDDVRRNYRLLCDQHSHVFSINLRSHVCNSPPEQAKSEEDGNMFTTHLDLNRWGPLPNNRTFDSADAANVRPFVLHLCRVLTSLDLSQDEVMAEVGMSSCRGSTLVSDRARPESVETRGEFAHLCLR